MAQKYLAGKIRLAFRQKLPGDTPAPRRDQSEHVLFKQ